MRGKGLRNLFGDLGSSPISDTGYERDINGQTPRRRMILFRGVCRFLLLFCYFSRVLFGGIWFFRIFAHSKGC